MKQPKHTIRGPLNNLEWEVIVDLPTSGFKSSFREPSITAAGQALRDIITHRDGLESGLVTHLNRDPLPPRP